ncbi:hypothetical protein [Halorubrum sp. Atlit-26R]|jgi:hypothetical protein|uniref:hypothetical protein n=1 Tax=Halorubrum sp. Atlit-26R TaxID=2282128 RepID=UPI0011C3F8CD|nr:hypothetical protein [Halorubrum sp. Atlit-26R]
MSEAPVETGEQPEHTIESPNRPFPLSAKQELREAAETVTYEEPSSPGEPWLAHVDELPDDDVLDRFELSVVREPVEVWESDSDERVAIYPEKVTADGYEMGFSPEEAKEKVREQDRFSPVDVGDT